jgi:hypothetical protein
MYRATLLLALVLLGTALKSCKKMATTYIGGYAQSYGPYAQGGTTPPTNQAPSVTINGSGTGTVGVQQSFQAIASDSDGQVAKVELCLMATATSLTGYTVLDTDLVSPFVLNWTPSSAGNFNLRMRATDDKGATSFSSVLAVQVAVANGQLKVLVLDHGTSLEQADQATQDKYGQSYPLHTDTNAIRAAQNAIGNTGRASSAEQLQDLWNAENNGITLTCVNLGYPGKDAYYFERNIQSVGNAGFNPADFDYIVHYVDYGVNGVEADQPGDSTDPADLAAATKRICAALTAPNPSKYLAFVAQPANRIYKGQSGTDPDTPLYVNFDAWRSMYTANLRSNLSTFAKGMDNIYEWPLGQTSAVNNYPNTLIVDGVHWTYLAQTQRAKSKARSLARFFGKTLSFGNGAAPTAPAAATIAISPATGNTSTQRTATLTTSVGYTAAELFRVNPLGVSYPPTLIGSSASLTFTPGSTARYYYRLTLTNGSYAYTSNFATATVSTVAPTTRTLDFTTHQVNFTPQPDGTLLKTGGSDGNHFAQATASVAVPAGAGDFTLEFVMPPLNNGAQGGGDFLIGLGFQPVPIDGSAGGIETISKTSFYANNVTARAFLVINSVAGPAGPDFPRAAPGDKMQLQKRVDGYYYVNATDPQAPVIYQAVPANGQTGGAPANYLATAHVISVVASLTGESVVPVITLTATQFVNI